MIFGTHLSNAGQLSSPDYDEINDLIDKGFEGDGLQAVRKKGFSDERF
jgi:hypothetical protein